MDQYINLSGHNALGPIKVGKMTDLAASRFLRPYSPRYQFMDGMRLHRMKKSMKHAAQHKKIYHLWWHPHNFGMNIDENLCMLEEIFINFHVLKDKYGVVSANMGDFA